MLPLLPLSQALYGGAFSTPDYAIDFTAISSTFSHNRAPMDGGAISAVSMTFEDCTFLNNSASGKGGAISDNDDTSGYTEILGGTFRNNSASEGGTVIAAGALNASSVNFIGNSALVGGAVYLTKDAAEESSQLMKCSFSGNSAASDGGGVATDKPNNLLLSGCTFQRNEAADSGAAVAVRSGFNGTLEVVGCMFEGNSVPSGGGGALAVAQNAIAEVDVVRSSFKSNMVSGTGLTKGAKGRRRRCASDMSWHHYTCSNANCGFPACLNYAVGRLSVALGKPSSCLLPSFNWSEDIPPSVHAATAIAGYL